jgi:hypothetical protein
MKNNYWYTIPGLEIDDHIVTYGVVNEHAVRASAGIMFFLGMIILTHTYYTHDIIFAIWWIGIFFIDFLLKVVFWPQYSPISLLGVYLVSYKKPEYVWAIQKRFAWTIGCILSGIVLGMLSYRIWSGQHGEMMMQMGNHMMMTLPPVSHLGLPFWICALCLVFMWLEVSLGFCVGCTMYKYLVTYWYIKKEENGPKCVDNACSL